MRWNRAPVLACGLLAACSAMGPDYQRPDVTMPAAWQGAASAPAPLPAAATAAAPGKELLDEPPVGAAELANTAWWSAIGDPQLDALIRIALDENKDLRIAAYRIDQFDAQLQVTQSAGKPQVNVAASRTRDALSQNRLVPLAAGVQPTGNNYEVSGAINWEMDFWGRIRRANEAAMADLLSTEESRRVLILSLVSDVASTYLTLLSLDRELDIHKRTVVSRNDTLQLLIKKFKDGGVAELPVLKARAEFEEAQADLTVKETEIVVLEHALSSLLGRNPGPIERGKPFESLLLPPIPGTLPADLLAQRPDVRKAEQDLVAANARIGVAKAQYLPNIGLTTQSGFASAELSKLTMLSSNFGTFGVTLLGPIFTSGRISGQVREAEAIQHEKATAFLLSVQTALREVEDALVVHRKTWQRSTIRDRQLAALREHSESALKRYQGGGSSYLEVLDAERSLYAGQIQQNQTRHDQYIALIAVYKAMGGGWSVAGLPAAANPNSPIEGRP
jgi:multidrug efflux system outer membrane protein